jgi:hypothetical protein
MKSDDASETGRLRAHASRFLVSAAGAALIWLLCWMIVPSPDTPMADVARLIAAAKITAVVILLTFAAGIEAVAHERLTTRAFDPLEGHGTRRLAVNIRYLQNTLEQLVLFLPTLFLLALYADPERGPWQAYAAALVWTLARFGFWIGYHVSAAHRVLGLVGAAQSLLLLLYFATRFGWEVAGWAGAILPITLFGLIEVAILRSLRRKSDVANL